MTVNELITRLNQLPQSSQVLILQDGAPRITCELAYQSKCGDVILCESGGSCYGTADRPLNAPDHNERPFYKVSEKDF